MEEYGPVKVKIEIERDRHCFNCDHERLCIVCRKFCTCVNLSSDDLALIREVLYTGNAALRDNQSLNNAGLLPTIIANMCSKFEPKKDKNAI